MNLWYTVSLEFSNRRNHLQKFKSQTFLTTEILQSWKKLNADGLQYTNQVSIFGNNLPIYKEIILYLYTLHAITLANKLVDRLYTTCPIDESLWLFMYHSIYQSCTMLLCSHIIISPAAALCNTYHSHRQRVSLQLLHPHSKQCQNNIIVIARITKIGCNNSFVSNNFCRLGN